MNERKRIVVGVNDFVQEDEEQTPILQIDPALERKQTDRLAATRARRDGRRGRGAARRAQARRRQRANLMPPIIEAARARATEGEMIAAMQEVFGTYTECPVF